MIKLIISLNAIFWFLTLAFILSGVMFKNETSHTGHLFGNTFFTTSLLLGLFVYILSITENNKIPVSKLGNISSLLISTTVATVSGGIVLYNNSKHKGDIIRNKTNINYSVVNGFYNMSLVFLLGCHLLCLFHLYSYGINSINKKLQLFTMCVTLFNFIMAIQSYRYLEM